MTIRRAIASDLDFLVRIDLEDEGVTPYRQAWDETKYAEHRRTIQEFIEDEDKGARIAVIDDMSVGGSIWRFRDLNAYIPPDYVFHEISSVFPADGRFCEIFQLWVEAAYRRQRIGSALKLAAEEDARSRGVSMIYTHTEERNGHVLDLNFKLGYREVRRGPIWDEVIRVSLVKNL